jgi:methyl-accepting chemotaxis protein
MVEHSTKPKLRERTQYKSTISYLDVDQFDYQRAAPGMADLMRRLYQVRIDCGAIEVDRSEGEAEQRLLKEMKKKDRFEQLKVEMKILLDRTRKSLEDLERDRGDAIEKQNLRKQLLDMEKLYQALDQVRKDAVMRKGRWSKGELTQELKLQRDEDMNLIKKHMDQLQDRYRVLIGLRQKKSKVQHDSTNFKLSSVDDLKPVSSTKEQELPQIDISAGLEQIKENKQLQEKYIAKISEQVGVMGNIAQEMSDELDLQLNLLDRLQGDVDKHINSLGTMNKNLDKIIEEAGGSTKLAVIGICCIAIVALIGVAILLIKTAVSN